MKIILMTPASGIFPERWIPLGLCYIASKLISSGHEVKIFDRYAMSGRYSRDSVNEAMLSEVIDFAPDIIGFNTYTPMIYDTIEAVRLIRSKYSGGTIILGGHHATAFPKLTLERIPEADLVITGEGEIPLCMVADGADTDNIPGLYKRDNGIHGNSAKIAPFDLDELLIPSYHLLDMNFYLKKNIYTIHPYYLSAGSVLTSRGCNNHCSYCTESLTFSGGLRFHSPEYALENIELLLKKYHCGGITFLDNNFLVNRNHAEAILRGIIRKRMHKNAIYCVQARADDIDDDIAKLMHEAGCRKVEIGLETYIQSNLDNVGKNLRVETSEQAVKICQKYGISVQANLIMGMEHEKLSDLDETLKWIKRLKITGVKWGMLILLPGSLLYKQKAGNYFENNDWSKENIDSFFRKDHLSDIPPNEMKNWYITKLEPYQRSVYHKDILAHNPPLASLRYYTDRIVQKGKSAIKRVKN